MGFGFFGGAKKRAAELHEASRNGDLDGVLQALQKGADINALDPECSETALHMAVDNSQKAVVDLLLSKSANPNIVSGQYFTPLIIAAAKGDVALPIVESLLAGKANPDLAPTVGPNAGGTPMHIAASNGSNAILVRLIASGAKPTVLPNGSTLMHMAAIGGDEGTVEIVTKTGISIDCTDSHLRTPLHLTGLTGNSAVAGKLLELGASIDERDDEDSTPLMHAALQNKPDVLDLLLKNGANPDAVATNNGSVLSPLYGAAINGFDSVIKLLLAAGVPADKQIGDFPIAAEMAKQAGHESTAALLRKSTKQKKSAPPPVNIEELSEELMQAVMAGDPALVKKLISRGANPNHINADGQCPLTLVLSFMMLEELSQQTRNNLRKIFDFLLENGADVNISEVDTAPLGIAVFCGAYYVEEMLKRNADVDVQLQGGTPLLAALGDKKNEECALALIAAGANLDKKSQNGQTALHGAAESGQAKAAKLILERRPDFLNLADNNGATPILLAIKAGHDDVVEILQDAGAVSPAEKLSRLRELIINPIVKSTIPTKTQGQIADLLNRIDKDGLDRFNDKVLLQLLQLTDQYEGILKDVLSRPPAFIAVQSGDLAELTRLLDDGYDINATIENNRSLLSTAVMSEHLEIVESLLERGANVNFIYANGYDALFDACTLRNADLASLLIQHGADITRRYSTESSQGSIGNQTALAYAASKGCFEICKMLLENGAELDVVTDIGSTPFMWALTNGASEQAALLLLEAGANPDPNITPRVSWWKKTSPLILAATNGMNEVVAKLLAKNVQINATDGDGATALKRAAHHGHEATVAMLMDAGASANIADCEGWTPLIAAASKGYFDICRRLIDGGADINVQSDNGATALGQVIGVRMDRRVGDPVAALRRRLLGLLGGGDESDDVGATEDEETLEMARLILEKGASPKVTAGADKELLIDVATNLNDQPLLDLLLSFGAELGVKQGDQLVIAASRLNIDKVTNLLESGVDVDHLDADGDTALSICVLKLCTEELEHQQSRDIFELIELLLTHDANVDVDGCRIAPLPMVARSGSLNLVNAFLRAGADPYAVLTEPDPDAGKTALEVAQESGHEDIVAALLEAQ